MPFAGRSRRVVVSMLAVSCLSAVAGLVAVSGATPAAPAGGSAPGQEIAELRTRFSQTFETEHGTRVARVFAEPVNFRDGRGRWNRIDSDLVDAGGKLKPAASDLVLELPRRLTGPV